MRNTIQGGVRQFGSIAVASLVAAWVAACAQQPPTATEEKPSVRSAPAVSAPGTPERDPVAPVVPKTNPAQQSDQAPAAAHSIFFAFDSVRVEPQFTPTLQRIAEHLRERQNAWVTLRAHTDDVGSREYNIALAQRRAEEVQAQLIQLGVPGSRVKITAYGEEQAGADAAASRRVDVFFRYSAR